MAAQRPTLFFTTRVFDTNYNVFRPVYPPSQCPRCLQSCGVVSGADEVNAFLATVVQDMRTAAHAIADAFARVPGMQ